MAAICWLHEQWTPGAQAPRASNYLMPSHKRNSWSAGSQSIKKLIIPCLHASAELSEESIPFGCYSLTRCDRPPTACQRRWGAVDQVGCPPSTTDGMFADNLFVHYVSHNQMCIVFFLILPWDFSESRKHPLARSRPDTRNQSEMEPWRRILNIIWFFLHAWSRSTPHWHEKIQPKFIQKMIIQVPTPHRYWPTI